LSSRKLKIGYGLQLVCLALSSSECRTQAHGCLAAIEAFVVNKGIIS
jgi:hypothetical protein